MPPQLSVPEWAGFGGYSDAGTATEWGSVAGEDEEHVRDEPSTIHLPAILDQANNVRARRGRRRQGHAAGAASCSLPQLPPASVQGSQTILKRPGRVQGGLPPSLAPASMQHRSTHPVRHSYPLPHHSAPHHHQHQQNQQMQSHHHHIHQHHHQPQQHHHSQQPDLQQLTLQAGDDQGPHGHLPASYIPPLSPIPPSLRGQSDGSGHATARDAHSRAAPSASAVWGSQKPQAGGEEAPVSSLTAAATQQGDFGAAAAGSEMDEIDTQLAAIGADMEQPGDDGVLAARLESLPCTLCTSAAGDMYMVGLNDVQYMLHKRKLGPRGLAILQRFENSVVQPLDAIALKAGVARDAQRPPMVSIRAPPSKSECAQREAGNRVTKPGSGGAQLPTHATVQGLNSARKPKSPQDTEQGGLEHRSSLAASSVGDVLQEGISTQQPSREESEVMDGGGMDDEQLDEEVRRHLEHVMELVEVHRSHLRHNNARTLAEQERLAASLNQASKTQAAIDFIVKRLVPEKLIAMARTRRSRVAKGNTAGPKPSLLKHLRDPSSAEPTEGQEEGEEPQGSPHRSPSLLQGLGKKLSEINEEGGPTVPLEPRESASGAAGGVRKSDAGKWGNAVSRMAVVDKLPFMANWGAAIKRIKKEDTPSWDEVMHSNQSTLHSGSRGKNQGAQLYMVKCQELGVVPSTQVVQQLRQAESDMSHCKLRRRGAQALRHALAINTSITDLNLTDNGLDSQGLSEVIQGLTYGFVTRKPKHSVTGHLPEQKTSLALEKYVPKSTDVDVNVIPAPLRDQINPSPARASLTGSPQQLSLPQISVQPYQSVTAGKQARGEDLQGASSPSPEASPRNSMTPAEAAGLFRRKKPTRMPYEPTRSSVQILDLSVNPLGVNGGRVIADVLDPSVTPMQFLVELRLVKCGLSEASGLAIARALQQFNRTLKVLSLANNAIGNKTAAAFGDLLMENATLVELDLGWNQIKSDGVKGLRKGLEGSVSLRRLVLAWNGLENEGGVSLGEMLVNNASLVHLDLTNTRLGSEACVMLAEGIKSNTTLEELLLNGNAIGDDGARHLMAALKSNNTLECLSLQGSNMSTAARGHQGSAEFNPLAPEGSYTLVLDNPTDRAVAAQLCKFDATSTRGPLIHNIKLNDQEVRSARDAGWPEMLPASGMLEFDFVARKIQNMVQVMDSKKFQAVVFQLESRSMSDMEKLSLVEIIAPFTYLYCHQVATILRCFSTGDELVRAAALLFTRAADLEENIGALTSAMQDYDIRSLQQSLGWYAYYRFSNPTGHYEFNLTTPVHQAFAVRLKDVAFAEPNEGFNWFNIVYDMYSHAVKVPANYGPPDMWKSVIPTRGTVSMDYVSTTKPPLEAQPISDEDLANFLQSEIGINIDANNNIIPEPDYSTADLQIALLRQEAGHRFWVSCAQVQRMSEGFVAGPHKVEVIVMMWALMVDRKNFWTILYSLPPFEQSLLMWRLGPLNVLDKAHPSAHYVLDLSNNLHEQCARRLVDMASKNSDVQNFWNLRLQGIKKSMPEGSNMWGTLTAESFTPWLEFDFIYQDTWDSGVLGKSRAEMDALGKYDKMEIMQRQARRLELQRIKAMYGYFYDGSGYTPPLWHTRSQMFKALLEKSPWLAAWDRLMRLLVRLDLRSGDIATDSYIEDIFDSRCTNDGDLTQEGFESICRDWGYSRAEVQLHFRRMFEVAAKPVVKTLGASDAHQRRMHFNFLPSRNQSGTGQQPNESPGPDSPGAHSPHATKPTSKTPSRSNLSKDGGLRAAQPSPVPEDEEALRSSKEGHLTKDDDNASQSSRQTLSTKGEASYEAKQGPVMVIDFATFVSIFMQEPPAELRYKEVPLQPSVAAMQQQAAASKSQSRSVRKLPTDRTGASRPVSGRKR